jgi:hypothetical protein
MIGMRLRVLHIIRLHDLLSYTSKYHKIEAKKGLDILVGDNCGFSIRLFIQFDVPWKESAILGKEIFFWGGESVIGKCEYLFLNRNALES